MLSNRAHPEAMTRCNANVPAVRIGRKGWVEWAFIAAIGLAHLLMGCDGRDVVCEFQGQTYAEGDRVTDAQRMIVCTCTSSGLRCEDASGVSSSRRDSTGRRSGQPNPPEMMAELDAGSAASALIVDASGAISAPGKHRGDDMGGEAPDASAEMADAAVPDQGGSAEPFSCPSRIRPASGCPANATPCGYGAGFDCCGETFPFDTLCRCVGGRWACEDEAARCDRLDRGERCARRGQVCARWADMERVRMLGEGAWGGDVAMCDAGDMSPEWRARVLTLVNGYRFLAGLGEVTVSDALNRKAQQCAVAQHALGSLEHNLPETAMCYSESSREASKASNLHRRPAVAAMRDYIADPGAQNFTKMRHRQWVLANQLGPIGIGSTDQFSCLYVWYGVEGDSTVPRWIAWPPPGPFPADAGVADLMGWTIHSTSVNLSRAEVTVRVAGVDQPIEFRTLEGMGPAAWAIAFVPVGWSSRPGVTYDVRVDGVFGQDWEGPIEYSVEMVDCGEL
ncbi:MAG: CAP domain-containing protein [Myxococcota bacterium]|nr:CAP domain-containing protein [Myxococcota bacterium]